MTSGKWAHARQRRPELFTGRWRKLAKRFRWEHPLCRPCELAGRVTVGAQVDHIDPNHPGYFDESNLQTICRACHNEKTLRDRGYTPRPTIGLDGYPIEETKKK